MYRRPYVESSAFIAFIKGETKGSDHDCRAVVESILSAAEDGQFKIFTSSLTIAEVFKNKKKGVQLTEQENEDLKPYFRENYIVIVEVDREIGERANDLCRLHQPGPDIPGLRPNDAIHLACAERADCEVLLAYDPDLTKQKHPDIDIKWPETIERVVMPKQFSLGDGRNAVQELLALGAPTEETSETKE